MISSSTSRETSLWILYFLRFRLPIVTGDKQKYSLARFHDRQRVGEHFRSLEERRVGDIHAQFDDPIITSLLCSLHNSR